VVVVLGVVVIRFFDLLRLFHFTTDRRQTYIQIGDNSLLFTIAPWRISS